MRKLLLTIGIITLSLNVIAGGDYSKSQLNNMVNRGEYPKQGPVNDTQTRSMSFSSCKVSVENIMSQVRGEYPVRTIVNSGTIYMVKAWTNDGAITATCSKSDQKMVLTQASYR